MVAESASNPSPTPQKAKRLNNGNIPIFLRLKARNLYLIQGLPYKAISAQTGLTVPCLERLACREKWTVLRKQAKERLLLDANTKVDALTIEAMESLADESIEVAQMGLGRARQAAEGEYKEAAKDFQAYTSGVKNLVGVAKAIREPSGKEMQPEGRLNVNLFFVRSPDKQQEAKTVSESDSVVVDLK